jgi:nucleoside-diphosphate-sugar epimerase
MSTPTTSSQVDWSKARVIVTGGAGFLGKAVQACLATRGVKKDNIFIPRRKDFDLTGPRRPICIARPSARRRWTW